MESFSLELDSSQLPPPHHSSLRSRIDDHYFQSDFPSKTYVPRRCIDDFVTEANIIDELDTKNLSKLPQRKDLIDWIQKKAPRAFLTIIDSEIARTPYELFASMQLLRHCNFEDGCLPWTNTSLFPDDQIERSNQAWIRNTWNRARVKRAFAQAQWKFLVPCISSSTFEYKLQQETILPFSLTDTEPKEGTFARVYPVTIPESHIDPFLQKVAVKEIKNTSKGVVDAVWYAEVRVLQTIRSLGNPHLIHCLAAIERGSDRYLLFPWAGGGSLREYWDATEHEIPTARTIRELLSQLKGLASALRELHYFGLESAFERTDPDDTLDNGPKDVAEEYSAGTSIRHGDLKPENLLWFLSDDDEAERCLKIADMGLAKRHAVATQDRSCLTSTRSATVLYEAPETVYTLSNKPRSRHYDIWSMGCITLEWIIWILYGNDQLQRFYDDLKGQDKDPNKWVPYYVINTNGYGPPASLHPEVARWITHIKETHPECKTDSAINSLIRVVETKLLIVDLPPRRPTTLHDARSQGIRLLPPDSQEDKVRYRATSIEFESEMLTILEKDELEPYLLTSTDSELRDAPPPAPSLKPLLHPNVNMSMNKHLATGNGISFPIMQTPSARNNYSLPPLEGWEFPVDNRFANRPEFQALHNEIFEHTTTAKLCSRCAELDFSQLGFYIEESCDVLRQRAHSCELCNMLLQACSKLPAHVQNSPRTRARFERTGSTMKLLGATVLPIFSLLRPSAENAGSTSDFQIGFPRLPQAGSDFFFEIVKSWLRDCDSKHDGCTLSREGRLPTRLIDLGTRQYERLRLVETADGVTGDGQYVALSHRWGNTEKHVPFCTRVGDLESFKNNIPYSEVPQTFRDAIVVTRRLGIRYLWIDSLCILQGDGGDFSTEAKRMEDVFSCAYCVIAASRASNQREGFLRDRQQRNFLTIRQDTSTPLYICDAIDDFGLHVLDGDLNSRGWVLQERALARRTIFFTDSQTYFECGKGVRCETMAKMQNNMADFLGDPRFPEKAMREKSRAIRIRYFQDLYRRYSQLEFSHIQDRPIAIAGLENRLLKAYATKGGYGIFDDGPGHGLFHRSLLWQRSEEEDELKAIDFSSRPDSIAPSWSWMAYAGGIDYIDPPFQETEWERAEIEPPWSVTGGGSHGAHNTSHLKVVVRSFSVAGAPERSTGKIKFTYDNPKRKGTSDRQSPLCVVIAKEKGNKSSQEKIHYVLVVIGTGGGIEQGRRCFSRLGVGFLPGRYIGLQEDGVRGIIC